MSESRKSRTIQTRKEQKLCVACGAQDERTKAGKRLCVSCAARQKEKDLLRKKASTFLGAKENDKPRGKADKDLPASHSKKYTEVETIRKALIKTAEYFEQFDPYAANIYRKAAEIVQNAAAEAETEIVCPHCGEKFL